MKHLFLGSFATGPPVVNEDDERQESAAHHCCDQYNGCPVQAVRDGVEGSLRQIAKKMVRVAKGRAKEPSYLFGMLQLLQCCLCSRPYRNVGGCDGVHVNWDGVS